MSKEIITLDNEKKEVKAGLVKASDLYERLKLAPDNRWLYLGRDKDIDIPLLPDDYIVIHGGEEIFEDNINQQIGKNPSVRNPLRPTFNDKKLDYNKAKITGRELREWDKELPVSKLFVDLKSQADAFIADDWTLVIQNADCYFTIPASEDDAIDLEECSKSQRKPPKGQKFYKIKIDSDKYKVEQQEMSGKEILALLGKSYDEWSLNQKLHGGRRKVIEPEENVDFSQPGIERFETVKLEAQQG